MPDDHGIGAAVPEVDAEELVVDRTTAGRLSPQAAHDDSLGGAAGVEDLHQPELVELDVDVVVTIRLAMPHASDQELVTEGRAEGVVIGPDGDIGLADVVLLGTAARFEVPGLLSDDDARIVLVAGLAEDRDVDVVLRPRGVALEVSGQRID